MLLPPIFSRYVPKSLLGASDGTSSYDGHYFFPNSGDYDSGIAYLWRFPNQYYTSDYYPVFDETGLFGQLPENVSLENANLYHGFIGQILQNTFSVPYDPWYSCASEAGRPPEVAVPYTKQMPSLQALWDYLEPLEQTVWQCTSGPAPMSGLHLRNISYNITKQLSIDGTTWLAPSLWGTTWDSEINYVLRVALLGKAMNYTYPDYLLYNSTDQTQTPIMMVWPYDTRPDNQHVSAPKEGTSLTFYWVCSMMCLLFLTSMFTARPVLERADGLVDVATMMGLSRAAHFLGNFVLDLVIYMFIYGLILILSAAVSTDVALGMLSVWVIIPSIIFGATQIFTGYLLAFAFRSPRSCLILSYIYSLIMIAIALVFNLAVLQPTDPLPGYLIWWPVLAYLRLSYLGLMYYAVPAISSIPGFTDLLRNHFLAQFFITIIVIILVFLLDRFGPTKLGNRGSTLNLFTDFLSNQIRHYFLAKGSPALLQPGDDQLVSNDTDPRVREEKRAVLAGEIEDPIMLIKNVSKVYAEGSKRFVALQDINFALREGDCFGLLGPNGAGKSTLVAIMSGILTPTTGTVTVSDTHNRCAIGLCPQEDIFYDDMTVEEHLLFYSRLKGKGPGEDAKSVSHILADVSMANERRRYARSLSGGQKRRLSVASALCGDPLVMVLDEPSSSLDPGSRIGLWEIIQSISKNRCTLITTHSMDEAEVLCNRIAIIRNGAMACLGSPSELKQNYAGGYKLLVSLYPSHEIQDLVAALSAVAPGVNFLYDKHGYSHIALGASAVLSTVCTFMEANKKQHGIVTWSLSRNGLDEVFMAIVEDRSREVISHGKFLEDDAASDSAEDDSLFEPAKEVEMDNMDDKNA